MSVHESCRIHQSAVVESGASLGEGCSVGPFSFIGSGVSLGKRVTVKPSAVVTGSASVGDDTVIFPFATIGEIPQDLKYSGEESRLEIGRRNQIREGVTVNTGTSGGDGVTRIGDDCLLMTGCHVAHDSQVGDGVVIVNHVQVGGHAIIQDRVILGALCGIHQHVRVGKGAIVGAMSRVTHDVLPYALVEGGLCKLGGLNLVGLRRSGAKRSEIAQIQEAFGKLVSGEGTFKGRASEILESGPESERVREIMEFALGDSSRSFIR